jgi:hypothetical protein
VSDNRSEVFYRVVKSTRGVSTTGRERSRRGEESEREIGEESEYEV